MVLARCKATARPDLAPAVLNVPPYASAPRRNLGPARYAFHQTNSSHLLTNTEASNRRLQFTCKCCELTDRLRGLTRALRCLLGHRQDALDRMRNAACRLRLIIRRRSNLLDLIGQLARDAAD